MRLNKFIAANTHHSRRSADGLIESGKVLVNGLLAKNGQDVISTDEVSVNGEIIKNLPEEKVTIMFNKPIGYVCSKNGQGSKTIYELLPQKYHQLNSVGRLDKDSSGLLLLTNDGELANRLTHPRYQKIKIYEVELDKPIEPLHQQMISDHGISLEDGVSKFAIEKTGNKNLIVTMHEGRNRQIRRTFEAVGYNVEKLHRIVFGEYKLSDLSGKTQVV